MKVELLLNDRNRQVLPISEGIVETRANLNLVREITWQHDTREPWRQHEWQQFMTRSKSQAGSYLTLVPSFTRMSRQTHRGWPNTIPYNIHKEVKYHPTRRHTKLLSLRDLIKISYAPVHNSNLLIGVRRSILNRHRRGLPPLSSEFQIRPLILLPIQYFPFSPNHPTRSHFKPFYQLFKFSTF
jgi:hypothetical protein